jgi:hypothetical protein
MGFFVNPIALGIDKCVGSNLVFDGNVQLAARERFGRKFKPCDAVRQARKVAHIVEHAKGTLSNGGRFDRLSMAGLAQNAPEHVLPDKVDEELRHSIIQDEAPRCLQGRSQLYVWLPLIEAVPIEFIDQQDRLIAHRRHLQPCHLPRITVTLRMPCLAQTPLTPRSAARRTKRGAGGAVLAAVSTGTSHTTVAGARALTPDHRSENVLSSIRCARTPSVATALTTIGGEGHADQSNNGNGSAARVSV